MPPSSIDLIDAKIVEINHLATPTQIQECLALVEKNLARGSRVSLVGIMQQKGYLTATQVAKIQQARTLHLRMREDNQYGKVCTQRGFITPQQLQECLELQKSLQYKERLYQILVRKRYITPEQHKQVVAILTQANQASNEASPTSIG
ncbi:MAG: hypothetical protein D6805_04625, partial [Planctomycetota bacterium]